MSKVITVKVTPEGMLVPHTLIEAWGDVEEVEIEQREGALIIKPKVNRTGQLYPQIVDEMKKVGLVEDLAWSRPSPVSPEERARLARKLGHGRPLSEIILEEREDRA
jgi:hypothetical protein